MDLYIRPGFKGVESYDSDCLVVITYLRLGGCPINLNACLETDKSVFENYPLLSHAENRIRGVSRIIEYLRQENYGLEYDLSDEELARLESLVGSLERRVTPACRWLLWADGDVYRSYTSPLYRSNLSFFQGLRFLRRWRAQIMESSEFSQLALCTDRRMKNRHREVETTLYEGARRCLTALSYILGDKQFFLGDHPSSIDAYVFGRLWPLLNYDRTCRKQGANINHRLISHIYQCENLLQLCRRVQRHCFPTATSTIRSSANEEVGAEDKPFLGRGWLSVLASASPSLPACLVPYRESLIFGGLVLLAFGVFAASSGLIGFSEEEDPVNFNDIADDNEEE